jgi:PAS domain S-box-containing protein
VVVINDARFIVLVNARLEQLFQYSREQLLGQPIEMLVPKQFRADHPQKVKGFIREARVRPDRIRA